MALMWRKPRSFASVENHKMPQRVRPEVLRSWREGPFPELRRDAWLLFPPKIEGRGGAYLAFLARSRGRRVKTYSVATGYQNRLKVLYSQKATPGSSRKTCRYIPSLPDRILDAPEIRNDYCKCSFLFAHWMEEEGLGTRQTRRLMPLPSLLWQT